MKDLQKRSHKATRNKHCRLVRLNIRTQVQTEETSNDEMLGSLDIEIQGEDQLDCRPGPACTSRMLSFSDKTNTIHLKIVIHAPAIFRRVSPGCTW